VDYICSSETALRLAIVESNTMLTNGTVHVKLDNALFIYFFLPGIQKESSSETLNPSP